MIYPPCRKHWNIVCSFPFNNHETWVSVFGNMNQSWALPSQRNLALLHEWHHSHQTCRWHHFQCASTKDCVWANEMTHESMAGTVGAAFDHTYDCIERIQRHQNIYKRRQRNKRTSGIKHGHVLQMIASAPCFNVRHWSRVEWTTLHWCSLLKGSAKNVLGSFELDGNKDAAFFFALLLYLMHPGQWVLKVFLGVVAE